MSCKISIMKDNQKKDYQMQHSHVIWKKFRRSKTTKIGRRTKSNIFLRFLIFLFLSLISMLNTMNMNDHLHNNTMLGYYFPFPITNFNCFAFAATATATTASTTAQQSINNNDDWRKFNYYQILALEPADYYYKQQHDDDDDAIISIPNRRTRTKQRSTITNADIKKAYRKQAQQWHPDKIKSIQKKQKEQLQQQHQQNQNQQSNNNIITIEECTARFAKIAEAYDTLSDQQKRIEYDLFLLDSEDELVSSAKKRKQKQQQEERQNNNNRSSSTSSDYYMYNYRDFEGNDHDSSFFDPSQLFTSFQTFKSNLNNFNPITIFEDFVFGHVDDHSSDGNTNGSESESSRTRTVFTNDIFSNINDFFDSLFHENDYYYEHTSTSSSQQYQHSDAQKYQNQQPDRTSEATQTRYDLSIQQEVTRILYREEYDDYNNHCIYYRIIGQEYIEDYNSIGRGYVPISDPYFVEDGYLPLNKSNNNEYYYTSHYEEQEKQQQYNSDHHHHQQQQHHHNQFQSNNSNNRHHLKIKRKVKQQTNSTMQSYEYISPQISNVYLQSDNKQFYAGLTNDCELVIIRVHDNDADNKSNHKYSYNNEESIIWSSDTFLPGQYQGSGCSFALYGGRIAVVVGEVDQPMAVLWNSPIPSFVARNKNDSNGEEVIDYYVSLDDDGSLAVYRTRQNHGYNRRDGGNNSTYDNNDVVTITKRWMVSLLDGEIDIPTYTKSAKAWRLVLKWIKISLKSIRQSQSHHDNTKNKTQHQQNKKPQMYNSLFNTKQDECVFASGPAGCFASGRYAIHVSKQIKKIIGKAYEDFVDTISEGSENDVDVIDAVGRVFGKVSEYFGSRLMTILRRNIVIAKVYCSTARDILDTTVTQVRNSSFYHKCMKELNILWHKLNESFH